MICFLKSWKSYLSIITENYLSFMQVGDQLFEKLEWQLIVLTTCVDGRRWAWWFGLDGLEDLD
jgi:hypothetical protein